MPAGQEHCFCCHFDIAVDSYLSENQIDRFSYSGNNRLHTYLRGEKEKMANQKAIKKHKRGFIERLEARNGVFIIPFLIVFAVFSVWPLIKTVIISFMSYKGYNAMEFIGTDNYARAFKDNIWWGSFLTTWKIWGPNIILQLGLAMILTMIFSDLKYHVKGLPIGRAIYYLPGLIAIPTVAKLFDEMFGKERGTVNQIIYALGGLRNGPIDWLHGQDYAHWSVSVIQGWLWFGNSFIMLMAAVQGVPKDYYEAASIDGANRWHIYRHITIPTIKPILLYMVVTSIIGGLQLFDMCYLLGGYTGDPNRTLLTMVLDQWAFAFRYRQMGYSAALAVILFFIIGAFSGLAYYVMYGKKDD